MFCISTTQPKLTQSCISSRSLVAMETCACVEHNVNEKARYIVSEKDMAAVKIEISGKKSNRLVNIFCLIEEITFWKKFELCQLRKN